MEIKEINTSEHTALSEEKKSIVKSHRLYVEIMEFMTDRFDKEKVTEAEVMIILTGILSSTLGAFDTNENALTVLGIITTEATDMIIKRFEKRAQQPEDGKEEQP